MTEMKQIDILSYLGGMKRLFFILILLPCFSFGQNLVTNPSFEDTVYCPFGSSRLHLSAIGWPINLNTCDHFHTCSFDVNFSVPNNFIGHQVPSTGSSYAGFYAWLNDEDGPGPPYSPIEVMGAELTNPLIVGQKYHISFKASLASDGPFNISNCAVDKLGALFTNVNYGKVDYPAVGTPSVVKNFAHMYTNQIVSDTSGWTVISGSFIADSAYLYIMIGRFFHDTIVNFSCWDTTTYPKAYYYIDDVCVSTDSLNCIGEVGIKEAKLMQQLTIYPNPTTGQFTVQGATGEIQVHDLFGRLVLRTTESQIDMSHQPKGVYILRAGEAVRKLILH